MHKPKMSDWVHYYTIQVYYYKSVTFKVHMMMVQ